MKMEMRETMRAIIKMKILDLKNVNLKWLTGICALALAIYAIAQSLEILQVGVTNQIPQLEGDGGGGILFAVLTFISALACLIKPLVAFLLFLITTLLSTFISFLFSDPLLLTWSAISITLAALSFLAHRARKNRLSL